MKNPTESGPIQFRTVFALLALLFAIYLVSYLAVRYAHSEVWEADKKVYVIFPEDKILYYVYRPMTIADGALTGMQFHIGPHR